MNQRWILIVLASLLAVSAFADSKFGKQVRYLGVHPIPKSQGGGICYIEGPHVHIYAANKVEFRDHGGDHVFVGDPVAYGYDGPRYTTDRATRTTARTRSTSTRSSAVIRTSSTAT